MFYSLSDTDKKAYSLIRNILIKEGRKPTLREINEITGGKSPRSASIVIDRLERNGLIKKIGNTLRLTDNKTNSNVSIETVDIPLIGTVTCGLPMLAQENIEAYIPVSKILRSGD